MRSKFDEQLRLLNQEMMYMGTMIEDSIQKAIEALIAQNAQLAEKIMNSDSDVDHEQKKIENICFNLLMQQQPVARDLRVISAAMKMVTDMERIGDHAADISEITIMLSKEPYVLNLDDIKKMASETVIMLIRSIEAYVEKDMNKAQEVIRHDDIVDDLFDKNKADIIELIRHDPLVDSHFWIHRRMQQESLWYTLCSILEPCFFLYPFGNQLVKLAQITIPEHADEKEQKPDEFAILDERFLEKPAFAMELCKNATIKMAEEAKDALELSLENLHIYDGKRVEKIIALEQSVDRYEDALGTYLVKLNNCDLSQSDSRTLSILLHCIGNFERISDHAVNITDSLTEMNQKDLHFSKKALEEMEVFSKALKDIVEATCTAFVEADLEKSPSYRAF